MTSLTITPTPVVEPATLDELPTIHATVLAPSFPSYELMALETLTAQVRSGETEVRVVRDEHGEIAGAAVGTWFAEARVMLLDYLALRPGARGGGLGGALLSETVDAWADEHDPCMVLAEVEHPDAHDPHPRHGDPEARLRFYERNGARLLPLPYFTPGQAGDGPRVGGMILTVLHAHASLLSDDAREIDSDPIARVLHLQAPDPDDLDAERTDLIATAGAGDTLPLLRIDRVGDVPIGIPDAD